MIVARSARTAGTIVAPAASVCGLRLGALARLRPPGALVLARALAVGRLLRLVERRRLEQHHHEGSVDLVPVVGVVAALLGVLLERHRVLVQLARLLRQLLPRLGVELEWLAAEVG